MKRITNILEVNDYVFRNIESFDVSISRNNFTDTAYIRLPTKLKEQNLSIYDFFKEDDKIKLYAGYDYEFKEIFNGYIAKIKPSEITELYCENESYIAKRTLVNDATYNNISLEALLTNIGVKEFEIRNYRASKIAQNLGTFEILNSPNLIDVFEKLKSDFGFTFFYEREKLIVEPIAYINDHIITCEELYNITSSNSLQFENETSYNVVSGVESKQKDKTILKAFSYYLPNGSIKTVGEVPKGYAISWMRTPNKSQLQCEQISASRLKNITYRGLNGGLTLKFEPFAKRSDVCNYINPLMPRMNGQYLISEVHYAYSNKNGLSQDLTLANKIK